MYTQQPHNTNNKKIPVLLVRHAQSLQNMGKRALMQTLTPQQKLNLQENPRYKQFSYRAEFLDADLSQLGFQQARQAREVMKNYDVDIVIVSPLKRALQTCQIIFQGRQGIKVFVQPLLGESLTAACDIGSCIQQSLEKYRNKYSFDKLSDSQWKTWYIDNIQNSEIRQKILKYNNKQKTTHQYVLELLRSHGKLQTQKQLKDRCIKLKQQIQIYSKQKKGVAIVAHYHLLKHLSCTRYNQEFKPIQCVQLWNAQIQRFLLSTQQQVQEQHNHNQEQINQQINEQVV